MDTTGRGLLPCSDSPLASAYGLVTRTLDRRADSCTDHHWLHTHLAGNTRVNGSRRRPRAFMPYVHEARSIVHKMATERGMAVGLSFDHDLCEPVLVDTHTGAVHGTTSLSRQQPEDRDDEDDMDASTAAGSLLDLPPYALIVAMRECVDALLSASRHQRFVSTVARCRCVYHVRRLRRSARLRVVREHGFDDWLERVLELPWVYYVNECTPPEGWTICGHGDERSSESVEFGGGVEASQTTSRSNTLPDLMRGTGMRRDINDMTNIVSRIAAGQLSRSGRRTSLL